MHWTDQMGFSPTIAIGAVVMLLWWHSSGRVGGGWVRREEEVRWEKGLRDAIIKDMINCYKSKFEFKNFKTHPLYNYKDKYDK